jgi:septum formation protein
MDRFILGSQSPRRKEILSHYSLPFEQASPPFDEDSISFHGNPAAYAAALAKGKADSLSTLYPNDTILTADTIVFKDGKVYSKPRDIQEAARFLEDFSNSWHSVFTALILKKGNAVHETIEETRVLFNPLTDSQIQNYLEKTIWMDKSGGYTIQKGCGILVRKIEGCYYNVLGLPTNSLHEIFRRIGIDLWHYLK